MLRFVLGMSLLGSAASFDRHLCKSCVINGCTYCRLTSDYTGGDKCFCPVDDKLTFNGPAVTCDAYYVGAVSLNSRPDCTFRSDDGEFFLGFLVVGLALCSWCIFGCVSMCKSKRKNRLVTKTFSEAGSTKAESTSDSTTPSAAVIQDITDEKGDVEKKGTSEPMVAVATVCVDDDDVTTKINSVPTWHSQGESQQAGIDIPDGVATEVPLDTPVTSSPPKTTTSTVVSVMDTMLSIEYTAPNANSNGSGSEEQDETEIEVVTLV
jgi:hypothetical protein